MAATMTMMTMLSCQEVEVADTAADSSHSQVVSAVEALAVDLLVAALVVLAAAVALAVAVPAAVGKLILSKYTKAILNRIAFFII